MSGKANPSTAIVKEAMARFPHLPNQTLARYLLYNYPGTFQSLEHVRRIIRYYYGDSGAKDREKRPKVNRVVQMPPTWRIERTPYNLPAGKWLCLFDLHIPFHEIAPIESAIKYGQREKVTGILLGGDAMDCAAVSHWPSTARRDLDAEIELFVDFLDFLRNEFPNAKIVYKFGNHEARLPRFLSAKAPELMGMPLAMMESVFGFEDRGIDLVESQNFVMASTLPILHGDEVHRGFSRAVNPARGLFLKAKSWALCGHFHTTSEHTERSIRNKILTCWSIGCLCDLNPEYALVNSHNWGCCIVEHDGKKDFYVSNKRILPDGRVV